MLRKIRIIAAWVVFALATLLVLDFSGTLHLWFGWLAKVQLVPAILAVNVAGLAFVAALTLLFGRIYCSVLCPLGLIQDGVSSVSARRRGKKSRFHYSRPLTWLRWTVLGVFAAALVAAHIGAVDGAGTVVSLLDPWAAFGRIAQSLLSPLWRWGNNLLAWIAQRADGYAFYSVDVMVKSWITLGVAAVTLILVSALAWRRGRTWCNSVCPVGTTLGFLSRWSLLRPTFNDSRCTGCGVCEKACKSSCIDSKARTIDLSRCVTCFDCVDKCRFDAMHYRPVGAKNPAKSSTAKTPATGEGASKGISRRSFISIAALFTFTNTVKAQQLQVDGGLADIIDKKRPARKTPIVPPGAGSARNMNSHCVACQLCVAACPNDVLVPSPRLATLMQPEMAYEKGYCRPECVRCSEVCPTSAIEKITPADKSALSIGGAVWIEQNCVVNRDNVACTECQRHCPTGAIVLVPKDPGNRRSLRIPTVDTALCIGCGACEHLCPARPFSAIYVEGNVSHHSV